MKAFLTQIYLIAIIITKLVEIPLKKHSHEE